MHVRKPGPCLLLKEGGGYFLEDIQGRIQDLKKGGAEINNCARKFLATLTLMNIATNETNSQRNQWNLTFHSTNRLLARFVVHIPYILDFNT